MAFDRDVTALIFHRLAPADLLSASQVCSNWRAVANDRAQLRSWTFDDDIADVVGTKASVTPMKPKTPLPKHWVDPTAFSPLASFKTPSSLNVFMQRTHGIIDSSRPGASNAVVDISRPGAPNFSGSPRTPSPIQINETGAFSDIVRRHMKPGRFLGDVDVRSSRLNDKNVQMILRSCPNLHTLRLQHICGGRQYTRERSYLTRRDSEVAGQSLSPVAFCGCGEISERAFRKVAELCPNITSLTLVLQHIAYKKVLRTTLAEIGALPKLNTLSVELRMPSFASSARSEYLWLEHARCSDSEVNALIKAGPPPLQALALNRCFLTESCVAALASACPGLEAIDLHSPNLENFGWPGLFPAVGLPLKVLRDLTAAAFGIFTQLDDCQFSTWSLPSLKRLRLEAKEPLSINHLHSLSAGCPKLESLHLIWETYGGSREVHIYPLTEANILEYVHSI